MSDLKLIIVNGAPRSGKDTFAEAVNKEEWLIDIDPIKNVLTDMVIELFYIDDEEWFDRYIFKKDVPWDKLEGMSQREALIWFSEDVMKPKFGKDFFGRKYIDNLAPWSDIVIAPDGGFIEELTTIVKHVGKNNCVMVNTFSDGCTFEKDSRSLITGVMLGIKGYDIHNNGTLVEMNIASLETFNKIQKHFN